MGLPWHRAASNYRRDFLDCQALLAARTAERDELRDELSASVEASAKLAAAFVASQSELAQRTRNDTLLGMPPRECSQAEFWLFVGELHQRWFGGRAA